MSSPAVEALLVARKVHLREVSSIGMRLGFVALPRRTQLDEQILARAAVSGEPEGLVDSAAGVELKHRLILRAVTDIDGCPVFSSHADVLELPEHVVAELIGHVHEVSRASELTEAQVKSLLNGDIGVTELLRVRFARELVAYWGLASARQASEAQVLYFLNARKQAAEKLDKK